jgi:hypothetical protein
MIEHVSWDTLNEYVDGRLAPNERALAAAHLEACGGCREQLAGLRRLVAAASDAPAEIPPPEEAWTALRSRLEGRPVPLHIAPEDSIEVPARTSSAPSVPVTRRTPHALPSPWRRRMTMAAAAVILVTVSFAAGARYIMLRGPSSVAPAAPDDVRFSSASFPADLRSVERDYDATIRELSEGLEAERAHLAPETVVALERSLAVIDTAIAEARSALARDPANAVLRDLFGRNYHQKVELLRRATALTQKS